MGCEERFERIINDSAWGKATRSLAFDGIMDRCALEKALYAEARKGGFEGVRALAVSYKAIYEQQAAQQRVGAADPRHIADVLNDFNNACEFCGKQIKNSRTTYAFKQMACEQLRIRCREGSWTTMASCDAMKLFLEMAFKKHIRGVLETPLIKAEKQGHGSYQSSSSDLERVIADVRLEPLIEAILDGCEKFVKAPRCRKEKLEDLLDETL